jgi:hypothetical protein
MDPGWGWGKWYFWPRQFWWSRWLSAWWIVGLILRILNSVCFWPIKSIQFISKQVYFKQQCNLNTSTCAVTWHQFQLCTCAPHGDTVHSHIQSHKLLTDLNSAVFQMPITEIDRIVCSHTSNHLPSSGVTHCSCTLQDMKVHNRYARLILGIIH